MSVKTVIGSGSGVGSGPTMSSSGVPAPKDLSPGRPLYGVIPIASLQGAEQERPVPEFPKALPWPTK